MNRIKEGYELAAKAGGSKAPSSSSANSSDFEGDNGDAKALSSPVPLSKIVIDEDTESMLRRSVELYKESLDKITDASILLSQCLQDELKSFNEIKKILEEISTRGSRE